MNDAIRSTYMLLHLLILLRIDAEWENGETINYSHVLDYVCRVIPPEDGYG